ncbi:MAG TPA: DeoR/GlpR family DNA-binding transcription regulator [Friedmanniella sp.]
MQAKDRQRTILELLEQQGKLAISELSARFRVSEMTVRRDLDQLEGDGLLRRTHGGAVRTESGSFEPAFALRSRLNTDAKRAIAAAVAREVADGTTLVLDGGSTGSMVAEALVGRRITVCALNMRVAEILAVSPDTTVMVPGGEIRHGEQSFVGPTAERTLADYRFDAFVMTASGVDHAAGFTEWNVQDAAIKRAALASASRCVVACDSSKFGQTAFARVAALAAVDLIVTDSDIAEDQRRATEAGGALLRIA